MTPAALQAINLQKSDLPSTWTAGSAGDARTDNNGTDDDTTKLAKCVGGVDTSKDQLHSFDSVEFTLGNTSVSSSASSYRSAADIAHDVAILKSPKLESCFQQLIQPELKSSLPAGSTLGTITIKVDSNPTGGPSNVVGRLTATIPVKATSGTANININTAFIVGSTVEAEVDAFGQGEPVPAALFDKLVTAVAARAAKS